MATHLKNLSDFSHIEISSARTLRFAILKAQWHANITNALQKGAYESLKEHGALDEDIINISVPGSYELISAANMLLESEQVDAIICLGCVIQGETRHFDFICQAVADGITNVSLKYNKPVIFGVLTPNTQEQAMDRAGGKHGNKGDEAAITAIKMLAIN